MTTKIARSSEMALKFKKCKTKCKNLVITLILADDNTIDEHGSMKKKRRRRKRKNY